MQTRNQVYLQATVLSDSQAFKADLKAGSYVTLCSLIGISIKSPSVIQEFKTV